MEFLKPTLLCLVVGIILAPGAVGAAPVSPRTPQFPLKTVRGLHTRAEIATARTNVARYPAAKAVATLIIEKAEVWLQWSDADLVKLSTSADVPRAFDVGTTGCPKCGNELYERYGRYPWIIDLRKPFKVTCPVDGTSYPTNDYAAYYHSGFAEKKGWDTEYVDDGWGWKAPNGERSWFVAHWNHELWHSHLGPGVRALGQAYLLTGDPKYAHKAALMLHRIAEVYPGMDHETQSRYGALMRASGRRYPGKVLNAIWETELVKQMAEAYDDIWDTIDGDIGLHAAIGKDGNTIRAFIEANLLEDAIDAYHQGKVAGNFGMHQSALVTLALARENCDREKLFDEILGESTGSLSRLGIRYALYNLVYRDGVPMETAPGYNALWVSTLTRMANLLDKAGRDVFAEPRFGLLYRGTLDIINANRFNPSLGDSGSVAGDVAKPAPEAMFAFMRHYDDPRANEWLSRGRNTFPDYASLFRKPANSAGAKVRPVVSRLLDGYGLAILNNRANDVSLSLYYGMKGGHGHFDRLGFELFAMGRPIMPDLGYPDAMNDYVPGIYTWSKNTVSHNTVTVDASRQKQNIPGVVRMFADSSFARVVDVEAPDTYPQATSYRRAMLMVDAGPHQSYFVDAFDVAGGNQQDYSLHGPPGAFAVTGGSWTPQPTGTLAGLDVTAGQIYDAPAMNAPGYKGGYSGYVGSGFQHLTNVRRLDGGDWYATWTDKGLPAAHVRIRVLPQPGQQIILANARVSPVNNPETLTYIIARQPGKDTVSRYLSVIEPYGDQPFIRSARALQSIGDKGTALEVVREDGFTDYVVLGDGGASIGPAGMRLETDASAAVITLTTAGAVSRVFHTGGSYLRFNGRDYKAPPVPSGVVTAVDAKKRSVRVRPDGMVTASQLKSLLGRVVHFQNDRHHTAHTVASVKQHKDEFELTTTDDIAVGRARITDVKPDTLFTDTLLHLAPIYRGATVATSDFRVMAPVKEVSAGRITLEVPQAGQEKVFKGADAWLLDIGPGDRLEVQREFSWLKGK